MLFALLYAVLRRVIGSSHPSADRELEIEVVVLRHQVKVLSRKVGRPKLRRIDKAFLPPAHAWCRGIAAGAAAPLSSSVPDRAMSVRARAIRA